MMREKCTGGMENGKLKVSKAQIKQVRALQQKKYRDELGLFVAEGDKCVEELQKGFELVSLYREGDNATRTEIEQMSGLQTPQGVVAVFRKRPQAMHNAQCTMHNAQCTIDDLVLVLDGVQNPGNLGTIIRTCDWFGVHDIVCSPDTADCYNPKVVQATMGALVRVRVHYADLPAWLETVSSQCPAVRIYGTLLDGEDLYETIDRGRAAQREKTLLDSDGHRQSSVPKEESPLSNPLQDGSPAVIVMGNEGNGISEEVRKRITHPIRIPSFPKDAETSESLNVAIAAAIVLAEFRRGKS